MNTFSILLTFFFALLTTATPLSSTSAVARRDTTPTPPDWELENPRALAQYIFTMVMDDNVTIESHSMSLKSTCFQISGGPKPVKYVYFDRGLVEPNFLLYRNTDCSGQSQFKGVEGSYRDALGGMTVGSWKID